MCTVFCFEAFSRLSFSYWKASLSFGHAIVTSLYNAPGEFVPWPSLSLITLLSLCPMSLTPYPRKGRPHDSKKVSATSTTGNDSLSRTVSRHPPDSQGSMRPHRVDTSAPRTFMQGISVLAAYALWVSWSKPTQDVSLHPRRFSLI